MLKLLVLDGNSIINRAFYGIKLLTTRDGTYTNAVVGFMNILHKLTTEEKPDAVAIAFDLRAPTFRHKMYTEYKAGRHGMPEELAAQMPVVKTLLAHLGYTIVTAEGYEADDILGSLAAAAEKNGDSCVIATGDRDSLQLVSKNVRVLLASTYMGKSLTKNMDIEAVTEKYGVPPNLLIDVKALMGDTSDNIPGVKGVGEKTATALIAKFLTLDAIYENIDDPFIKKSVREKLIADKEQAYMSRTLAEIVTNVPVELSAAAYKRTAGDPAAATKLLASLEMYGTIEKLGLAAVTKATPQMSLFDSASQEDLDLIKAKPLPAKLSGTVDIALAGDEYILVQGNKIYTAKADDASFIKLLKDEDVSKRCFDSKTIFGFCPETTNITFDALIAAYLLNPATKTYNINTLAFGYGVKPLFSSADEIAGVLTGLFDILTSECSEQGMMKLLTDIEQPLAKILSDMQTDGIEVDRQGLETFGKELRISITAELAIIYEIAGYEFNVNSPKQLGEALFERLELPSRKKTKSGFSTDAETLESLKDYSPIIEHILLYRTYQKLNSTYVEGLLRVIGEDGRVHSTFNQTETRTGRISSGEPNLQNIPVRTELGSRLRKFFTAPEGYILLDADYSQIELRILAAISEDVNMQAAFTAGDDIHRATASRVFNVPFDDVSSQLRSRAKAVNFGIVYGIGAFSLAKDIGVSVKEADAFIKQYLLEYSGVQNYMDKTIADGRTNGYVTTLYGRRRLLPEMVSSNHNIRTLGERMAMNTPIQGTAADIIKIAMIKVAERLKSEGLKSRLILQVHDELIVEAPIDEADRASVILGQEMENAAALSVKLPAEVNRGTNWYNAKG